MRKQFLTAGIIVATSLAFTGRAQAQCENPAGTEGQQMYNATWDVMQFCNGSDEWISMADTGVSNDTLTQLVCTDGQIVKWVDSSASWICYDFEAPAFYDEDNNSYYVDPASTSVMNNVYASAFYYNSDERLKENIENLPEPQIDRIYELQGVTFDWKETGVRDIGFIAQSVQKVFPELVSKRDTPDLGGVLGVKYGNIVPILVEAVKAQKAEIDLLKEQMKNIAHSGNASTLSTKTAQSAAPTAQEPEPSIEAIDSVKMADLPYANDPSICRKYDAPACLEKDLNDKVAFFNCNTEVNSYIYSGKIYYLCARGDETLAQSFAGEYKRAIAKAETLNMRLDDPALDALKISHAIALGAMLSTKTLDDNALGEDAPPTSSKPQPKTLAVQDAAHQSLASSGVVLPGWLLFLVVMNIFLTAGLFAALVLRRKAG